MKYLGQMKNQAKKKSCQGGRLSISTVVLRLRYPHQRDASDPLRGVGNTFLIHLVNFEMK